MTKSHSYHGKQSGKGRKARKGASTRKQSVQGRAGEIAANRECVSRRSLLGLTASRIWQCPVQCR